MHGVVHVCMRILAFKWVELGSMYIYIYTYIYIDR